LLDLPKKREYILYAPLSEKQKELYDAAIKGQLREVISAAMQPKLELKEVLSIAPLKDSRRRRPKNVNYLENEDDEFESADPSDPAPIPKEYQSKDNTSISK
jgi:ATP-dependent DNA helicase